MRRAVLARHSANHPCLKSEVKGLRPLHVAVMFGRAEVVAALLALKARPEETADGMFKGRNAFSVADMALDHLSGRESASGKITIGPHSWEGLITRDGVRRTLNVLDDDSSDEG